MFGFYFYFNKKKKLKGNKTNKKKKWRKRHFFHERNSLCFFSFVKSLLQELCKTKKKIIKITTKKQNKPCKVKIGWTNNFLLKITTILHEKERKKKKQYLNTNKLTKMYISQYFSFLFSKFSYLLDLDRGTDLLELGLELFGVVFGHVVLEHLRSRLDELLRLD